MNDLLSEILQTENEPITDIHVHFLESIVENSYDGIYITDADGLTLLVNKSYERIAGMKREKYIGKRMSDLMNSGIMKTYITKDVVRLKRAITVTEVLVNGKEVIITGNPVFNNEGKVIAVVTNVRDVTELLQLEKMQALSEESLNLYKKELFKSMPDDIICADPEMERLKSIASKIAVKNSTVLILGETGVGKDVFARHIHLHSARKDNNYIKVNCGSIPAALLESELFGYAGGAFTGASSKGKIGLFELADGGTLFLDEIGELPFDMQASLLRVLQDGEIKRVGDPKSRKVNVRIIAATNRDLELMIKEGKFRQDLYYRLNVVSLNIPPLRDRKMDIPFLAEHFLDKLNEKYEERKMMTHHFINHLKTFEWPGNIRELENYIERQFVMSDSNILDYICSEYDDTDQDTTNCSFNFNNFVSLNLKKATERLESTLIGRAMDEGKTSQKAAELLGISQPTFSRKYNKYFTNNIKKEDI